MDDRLKNITSMLSGLAEQLERIEGSLTNLASNGFDARGPKQPTRPTTTTCDVAQLSSVDLGARVERMEMLLFRASFEKFEQLDAMLHGLTKTAYEPDMEESPIKSASDKSIRADANMTAIIEPLDDGGDIGHQSIDSPSRELNFEEGEGDIIEEASGDDTIEKATSQEKSVNKENTADSKRVPDQADLQQMPVWFRNYLDKWDEKYGSPGISDKHGKWP